MVTGPPLLDNVSQRFPAADAPAACTDTPLRLTFKVPFTVAVGRVQIWRAGAPDTLVDTVRVAPASEPAPPTYVDSIGGRSFRQNRPVFADEMTAIVYLHRSAPLMAGQTYYVTIDDGLFLDAAGGSLGAIVEPTTWRFTTRTGVPAARDNMVVALDGSGDFCSVQSAIDAVPTPNESPVTITLEPGTYREILYIKNKSRITFRGEDRKTTVVAYANNEKLQSGTAQRAMVECEGSNELTFENFTLRNTTPQDGGQAEAIRVQPGDKVIFRNMDLASLQDTLLLAGRIYVVDSTIEGNVDYIWGTGVAYFEKCDFKIIGRKGYNVMARNAVGTFGYVFVDSTFTAAAGITGHLLGRIDAAAYMGSHVAYINNKFSAGLIAPVGWQITNTADTSMLRFWEYQSTDLDGNPLDVSMRAPASKQLNEAEAAMMRDKSVIFGGAWLPTP